MPQSDEGGIPAAHRNQQFTTTHWSVVLTAGADDSSRGQVALQTLCQTYWPPIYGYLRWMGYDSADAQDLTQDYFALLLRKNLAGRADPQKGRFRSFLLHTLKQFVSDQRSKSRAQKRGGDAPIVSLDVETEESRGLPDPATHASPDRAFDRRWVEIVLDRVKSQLQHEYTRSGRRELFDRLKSFQPGEQPECSQEEAAQQLSLSLPAVKSAIYRLRRRHGELLREEIAQTVSHPDEVQEEIRYFITCWSQ